MSQLTRITDRRQRRDGTMVLTFAPPRCYRLSRKPGPLTIEMNILFANATVDWGGVKTWTLEMACRLSNAGHRVEVIGRKGDRWVDACRAAGLETHALVFGPHFNPWAIARMTVIARRMSADCLVVNIARDLCAGAVAGLLSGLPVVRRLGLPDDPNDEQLERLLFRLTHGMVTVGHAMRREMLERNPWMDADKVVVIHTGKDLDRYRTTRSSGLAGSLDLGPEAVLIGVSSQLERNKGHRVLLDAYATVAASHPQSHLVVAGEGPERAALERQAGALGIGGQVTFVGFQSDIATFLEGIDLFALPSYTEALPNSLLEAMAAQTACIATAVGSVAELISDGENGCLVEAGQSAPLARCLDRLLADPVQRSALALAARSTIEENFSLDDKAAEFGTYLATIVAAGRGG